MTSALRWEWDEAKRQSNLRKHGIDFRDVTTMFDRPLLRRLDTREEYGEDRWIGIGFLEPGIAVVIYVEKQADLIRIISARKANPHERRKFREFFDRLAPSGGFRRR